MYLVTLILGSIMHFVWYEHAKLARDSSFQILPIYITHFSVHTDYSFMHISNQSKEKTDSLHTGIQIVR